MTNFRLILLDSIIFVLFWVESDQGDGLVELLTVSETLGALFLHKHFKSWQKYFIGKTWYCTNSEHAVFCFFNFNLFCLFVCLT